jgi:hypothetical protein
MADDMPDQEGAQPTADGAAGNAAQDKTSTNKIGAPGENAYSQEVPPPSSGEEGSDPLLNLIDRVTTDGRAAYAIEVLEALCQLEDDDPGRFTQLRWQLLQNGVVPDLLRRAMQKVRSAAKKRQKDAEAAVKLTDVQLLIKLGTTDTHLFHTPDDVPFADYRVGKHTITGIVANHGPKSYGGWLQGAFYRATGNAPSNESLTVAINTLAVKALHDGPEIAVYPRIGWFEDRIYIDRGSPDWSVVEVDRDGWRVIERAPIRFIRSAGAEALPVPVQDGTIDEFRALFPNLAGDDDFTLTIGWVLASFNPDGGYPILGAFGPYGSAKSTLLRGIRRLIDPNKLDTRMLPASERDMMVVAQTSWTQSFDNVSHLSEEMSDAFCRLSTGASFGARKLFTDTGEIILTARRPAAFTGIVEVIERPDLVDRTFFVATTAIPDGQRLSEKEFWKRFSAAWPGMLGALLDAASWALRHCDDDPPKNLPRMADAAVWVSAGEGAFGWEPGTFLAAYRRNTLTAARTAVESDLVGAAVIAFMSVPEPVQAGKSVDRAARRESWSGTVTELLQHLRITAGEGAARGRSWPKTPSRLGKVLRPLIPALAKIGIALWIDTPRNPQRLLTIEWADSPHAGQTTTTEPETSQERASPSPEAPNAPTSGCTRTVL